MNFGKIALKNEQAPTRRRLATLADVEAAIPEALNSGAFFFADIERNQTDAGGLALLRILAAFGAGASVTLETLAHHSHPANVTELEQTVTGLIRRELIEQVGDGYRFQVELIRRWFARN